MISVGVPTYNEEKVIGNCISSILKQISKKDEVIVVASGCTDRTAEFVKNISKKDKRVKLLVEKERKGKASALNLILKKAKGEIIVQTDGDVTLEDGAVKNLIKHFSDRKIGAVSGNPVPIIPKNNLFYEWTIMSYKKASSLRIKETREGDFWHLSGYLCAFRKKSLDEVPFAKGAVDAWMGKLILEKGYKLIYEPDAKVFVKTPTTIRDFVNQKARVRAGYFFLARGKGKSPRKMKSEFSYFFPELSKIPLKRWPAFFISAFIYTYSWLRGWYLYKSNKSLNQIWKHIETTKK